MNKRFALIIVTVMVFAALLSACSSESQDTGKDYMEAVIKGDEEKAAGLACDSFDGTPALIAFFRDEVKAIPDSIELKVDMGKTNNQEQLRIAGSVDCDRTATAAKCTSKNEYVFSEKNGTLVILKMKKVDGDWCVTEESEFEGTPLDMTEGESEGEAEGESEEDTSTDTEATEAEGESEEDASTDTEAATEESTDSD